MWGGRGGRGACACGGGGGWGGGGRGDFRRSKSAPQRHYQLWLRLYKQKQSADKQSVIKPHFTRHAGKAGGLLNANNANTNTMEIYGIDGLKAL